MCCRKRGTSHDLYRIGINTCFLLSVRMYMGRGECSEYTHNSETLLHSDSQS